MKIVALLVIISAAGIPLAAAGDDFVIYLRPTDALNLDPWQADDQYSNEVAVNIFEGLVRFRKNSTAVEPCLATAWSVHEGGKRWLFTLRRGVRFHDGTPFDARAVLYSFQSRLDKKQRLYQKLSFLFSFITGIRSLDPYRVEITLDRPYAPFLVALADSAAFVVPPSARSSAVFQPIGTGPFRFLSWAKGKSLILVRNPDYWAGPRGLERILFKVMPDSGGRLLQIKNGSADMAKVQSGKEFEELSRRSDIAILRNPSIDIHYLGFNTRRKPFDRREVRAAFLHIINKGSMVKQIYQKLADPAYSSLPPPLYPGRKLQPLISFDLEAARILLKQNGLQDGFTCSLYYPYGQEGVQEIADLLAVMARKIKITIKKIKLPFADLINAINRGEHDMLIMGWSTAPDPDFFLYPLFTFSPGNRNRFFYENPKLTRLLDLGKTTLPPRQRNPIYLEALAILKKEVPWIPLFHLYDIMACSKKIRGLGFSPLGQAIFREVTKESTQ
jgi:peptide/nickel transport system substrate-binding protein